MRDLAKIIEQIQELLPETDEAYELDYLLSNIKDSIFFTAPEMMYLRWTEVHTLLIPYLFDKDEEYIQEGKIEIGVKILSIFSDTSEDSIRENCVK